MRLSVLFILLTATTLFADDDIQLWSSITKRIYNKNNVNLSLNAEGRFRDDVGEAFEWMGSVLYGYRFNEHWRYAGAVKANRVRGSEWRSRQRYEFDLIRSIRVNPKFNMAIRLRHDYLREATRADRKRIRGRIAFHWTPHSNRWFFRNESFYNIDTQDVETNWADIIGYRFNLPDSARLSVNWRWIRNRVADTNAHALITSYSF